ncbi:hypothetical protein EDB83DRAFT_899858 [Lactarius deliciosus]|nr:hypothetical protein EDB83DRAFT_899858 [Lactarius deliciosus]
MFNPYAHSFHEGLYRTSMAFWGTYNSWYLTRRHVTTFLSRTKPSSRKNRRPPSRKFSPFRVRYGAVSCLDLARLGTHHRRQRKMPNPVVDHMRHTMAPIFHRVVRQLRGSLESIVSDGPQEINIADWIDRFTLELLEEAGFGYSFGTLEGRNDEYCRALNE